MNYLFRDTIVICYRDASITFLTHQADIFIQKLRTPELWPVICWTGLSFLCVLCQTKLSFWVSHCHELLYAHPHPNKLFYWPSSSHSVSHYHPKRWNGWNQNSHVTLWQLGRWKLVQEYLETITHNKILQGSSVWFSSVGFSWYLSAAHSIPVCLEHQKEQCLIW